VLTVLINIVFLGQVTEWDVFLVHILAVEKWPTWCTVSFLYMFISVLYIFWAKLYSSSGEKIVSIRHLVCRSGRNRTQFLPDLLTRRSPTQTDIYQTYWYNCFSWWWARGCSKHVENWNKYISTVFCVMFVTCQNYIEMHGRQNIKSSYCVCQSWEHISQGSGMQ
jgi:hypothetical protein